VLSNKVNVFLNSFLMAYAINHGDSGMRERGTQNAVSAVCCVIESEETNNHDCRVSSRDCLPADHIRATVTPTTIQKYFV